MLNNDLHENGRKKKRSKSPVGHDAIYRIERNLPLRVQAIIGITNSPSKFFKVTVATPAKITTNFKSWLVLSPGDGYSL